MTKLTNYDKTHAPVPVEVRNEFMDFTAGAVFGETWSRPGLSLRDRSLVTIASLVASGADDELIAHIRIGLNNGLTREEISETIWHLAIYAGWPRAFKSFAVAHKIFQKMDQRAAESGG